MFVRARRCVHASFRVCGARVCSCVCVYVYMRPRAPKQIGGTNEWVSLVLWASVDQVAVLTNWSIAYLESMRGRRTAGTGTAARTTPRSSPCRPSSPWSSCGRNSGGASGTAGTMGRLTAAASASPSCCRRNPRACRRQFEERYNTRHQQQFEERYNTRHRQQFEERTKKEQHKHERQNE